jgi:hypothetical protein
MAMSDDELRKEALQRIKGRRAFQGDLTSYLIVNAALIGIWAFTGRRYFWPGWVLFGWGIGLALHAVRVYGRRTVISEDEIRREVDRLRGGPPGR